MKWIKWWYSPLLFIAGCSALFLAVFQPVTIDLNGKRISMRTIDLTVGDILQQAGIELHSGDVISPQIDTMLITNQPIEVRQLSYYTVDARGKAAYLLALDDHPANVLMQQGIRLFPGDQMIVDGLPVPIDARLEYHPRRTLLVRQAPTESPIEKLTNGQELARSGMAPQGMDVLSGEAEVYNGSPIGSPERVADQLEITQKSLPFNSINEMDPKLDLDQQKVTQVGSYGLALQLNRTRYRNGVAGETRLETETIVKPAVDQITGYGTKINVKTLDVGGTTIEYYRALSLYATSYSPCRTGIPGCHSTTASGAPAAKGIVAVVARWYPYMVGARVYIPGYGFAVVGDTGGGIPGTPWIDLAYSEEDYVGWHSYVMVYFLTPVPDNLLYDLN